MEEPSPLSRKPLSLGVQSIRGLTPLKQARIDSGSKAIDKGVDSNNSLSQVEGKTQFTLPISDNREGNNLHNPTGSSPSKYDTLLAQKTSSSNILLKNNIKKELENGNGNISGYSKDASKTENIIIDHFADQTRGTGSMSPLSKLRMKDLLPHQQALKDSKHTIYFSHFQKSNDDSVYEGNTVRMHMSTAKNLELHQLDAFYERDSVNAQYERSVKERTDGSINPLFTPLKSDLLECEYGAVAFMDGSSKNGLTIQLVSDIQKTCLLMIRSCLESIKIFSRIFMFSKKEKLSNGLLLQIQNLLSLLICYLHDQDYVKGEDYSKFEFSGEPLKERQSVLKELGVLDALMSIIHFPFANNFYSMVDIHKPLYISRVIRLSYSAIKSGIQEIRTNELYASQWLDMIIDYSLRDTQNLLHAKVTLTEMIDNNEQILTTQIKEATIAKFIEYLLASYADEQAINILRATCVCEGKPVLKNQELITNILVLNKENLRLLISELKFREDGQLVTINPFKNSQAKMMELRYMKEKSEAIDKGKYFNFYLNMVSFFSDICLGRNYPAINVLKEFFSLEAVSSVICSNDYCYEHRNAFCGLLRNMYIHVFPFQSLIIPYCVRSLNDLHPDQLSGAMTNNTQLDKFSTIIQFIFDFLTKGYSPGDLLEIAEFTVSLLHLCDSMICLGFFKDLSSFKIIYAGLMRILSLTSTRDEILKKEFVKSSPTRLRLSSELHKSTGLEMHQAETNNKVRKAVCSLLRVISTLEIDFSITNFLGIYKSESKQVKVDIKSIVVEDASLIADSLAVNLNKEEERGSKKLFEILERDIVRGEDKLITKNDQLISALIENTLSTDIKLKELSLELIKELYSETKSLTKSLKKIIVVETENQLSMKNEVEELHKVLFKIYEKITVWYNKQDAGEYLQLKGVFNKLDYSIQDNYSAFDVVGFGEDAIMSEALGHMVTKYVFAKMLLGKSLKKLSTYYQNIVGRTGFLKYLLSTLEFMMNHAAESTPEILETNRFMLNELTLVLIKCIFDNSINKQILVPLIIPIMELIPKFYSTGVPLVKKELKTIFTSNEFDKANAQGLSIQGLQQAVRDSSSLNYQNPAIAASVTSIPKSNQSLVSIIPSGDFPLFGNLISLVIQIVVNNRKVCTDTIFTEKIIRAIIYNLRTASKKRANYFLAAQYLYAMEVLIFDGNYPVKVNQDITIRLLVENNREGILARYINTSIATTLIQDFKLPFSKQTIENSKVEVIPARICADMSFLDLLTLCCYGKNGYSERIAQRCLSPT